MYHSHSAVLLDGVSYNYQYRISNHLVFLLCSLFNSIQILRPVFLIKILLIYKARRQPDERKRSKRNLTRI